jgi:hypothetical protein
MDDMAALGKLIGKAISINSVTQQAVAPDDPSALYLLGFNGTITATAHGTITTSLYPSDSFILDHPVYCNLNSSVLKLDGGYASSSVNQTF